MNRKKYGFVFCLLVVIAMISLGTVSIYVNHEEKKEATEQLRVVTSFYPMYVAAMNVTDSCESVTLENLSERLYLLPESSAQQCLGKGRVHTRRPIRQETVHQSRDPIALLDPLQQNLVGHVAFITDHPVPLELWT